MSLTLAHMKPLQMFSQLPCTRGRKMLVGEIYVDPHPIVPIVVHLISLFLTWLVSSTVKWWKGYSKNGRLHEASRYMRIPGYPPSLILIDLSWRICVGFLGPNLHSICQAAKPRFGRPSAVKPWLLQNRSTQCVWAPEPALQATLEDPTPPLSLSSGFLPRFPNMFSHEFWAVWTTFTRNAPKLAQTN